MPVKFDAERVCPECGVAVITRIWLPFCSAACLEAFAAASQVAAEGDHGGEDQSQVP